MASRKSSASKLGQQRVTTSSRGGPHGESTTKQKRSVEPETLVSLKSKAERTPSSARMMVMEPGDGGEQSRSSSCASFGRSLSSLGQVPPQSDSSINQRVGTPTKHVSLTAVRRKQESEITIEPELDWREFTRSNSSLRFGVLSNSQNSYSQPSSADEDQGIESSSSYTTQSESGYGSKADMVANPSDAEVDVASKMQAITVNGDENVDKSAGGDKSSDDDDDESGDEEPRKAPNELFMEFLECLMKKEFATAEKLCRMILIYEPGNAEAQKFHPIILEKLQLDKEAEENGDNDEDGNEDEEDGEEEGDDDDDDSDDDSDDDTSLDDDSDDEDAIPEENEDEGPPRPDSGIGM